ncbi:MAG: hypothetical protein GY715_12945, partial [Planctomycetes bacterium]|nr:hypothetical protein [Planctomycetota bacterium]
MTRRCLRRTVFTALLGASAAGGSAAAQCVETTLTSPAAATNDYARSVAVTDDLVIVGDPRLDEPGRVLVYSLAEGGWAYETTLLSAAAFAGDQFGYAVAAAGNLVVVGVYAADVTGFSSGAVHVYRRLGATWALEDQLAPSDGDMGDRFGWAVSTDGERVLVGARSDENDGLLGSGSAYVFRHTGDGWLEEAKLTDPNRAANDAFGFSVSLAGTTALVGASGDDDPGLDSGAAHVFRHVGIGWVHEAELEATDAEGQERFGRAVALAANIAVVGASHDGDDGTHSGSAYVY